MIKRMVSTLLLIVATVSLAGYADLYLPKYAANGRGGSLPELMANCLSDVVDDIPVEELVHIHNRRTKYFQEELSLRAEEIEIELPEPYMEAYYDFLLRYWKAYMKNSYSKGRFVLAYIDEDDIPELLIIEMPCHATSVSVYTYYDGKVTELGAYGSTGRMQFVDRKGMIVSYFMNMGESYSGYYQINNGKEHKLCEFRFWEHYGIDGEDIVPIEKFYEVNGVEVTQAEYEERENLYWSDEYRLIGYEEGVSIVPERLKKSLLAMKCIADSEPWKILDAYEKFLNEVLNECEDDEDKKHAYTLVYLDEDNIPELVLVDKMAAVLQPKVYTYEQGVVVPVDGMENVEIDDDRYISLDDEDYYSDRYCLREQLKAANGIDFE